MSDMMTMPAMEYSELLHSLLEAEAALKSEPPPLDVAKARGAVDRALIVVRTKLKQAS